MSDFGKVEIARLSFLISCTRGPPYAWLQPTFRRTGLAPGHPDELVPPNDSTADAGCTVPRPVRRFDPSVGFVRPMDRQGPSA